MQTLLLDTATWDLVLDANGNIAVASDPYSLAQDAASAIKTFLGEVYWDTTLGTPWLERILGQRPSIALIKSILAAQAMTVPGVSKAVVFITSIDDRTVTGQVQITPTTNTQTVAAANFVVVAPKGQ